MREKEKRPKRRLEESAVGKDLSPPSKRWKNEEMERLLKCLMKNGHKNFDKLQDSIPERNLETIKLFMRTLFDTSTKFSAGHENLDAWIDHCKRECLQETPWKDSFLVAQIVKYLSIDGLIENHPLPDRCSGINFSEAYQLIYQALLGYPIQPVSEPTAHFVQETLKDILNEIKKESAVLKVVKSQIVKNLNSEELPQNVEPESKNNKIENVEKFKKPMKVYQKKKSQLLQETPTLKIVVEPTNIRKSNSSLNSLQDYSVTVAGIFDECSPTVISVPININSELKSAEDKELLNSTSFNPLKLPENWLREPLFLNISQQSL